MATISSEPLTNQRPPSPSGPALPAVAQPWLVTALLALALLWSFGSTLADMAQRWSNESQYSHGFLVPVFAAILLWTRRERWLDRSWEPCLWGLPLFLAGIGLRLVGARMYYPTIDAVALLPTLAGLVLLVGGKSVWRWAWPAIAFLAFMLPLPYFVERGLSLPLRRLATVMSTYLLECLGYPAIAEGNIILIDDIELGVAEACSGLGMLMTFFALSAAFAMVIRKGWVDRSIIVLSAIPIAVIANVLRITATGVAYVNFGRHTAQVVMHDVAGWLMMPLALGFLAAELWFLDRLFLEVDASAPLTIQGVGGRT